MKEYGGYLEYERYGGREYYQDAVPLNCGRNCLRYLIECRQIEKICLPYFLCDSVSEVCQKAGVHIRYYHINENFQPILDWQLDEEEYLYIVNFYGQLEKQWIENIKKLHQNIIVDNAQAFFEDPIQSTDTLYVLRKYFGVSDGAYLVTNVSSSHEYPIDSSYGRMGHLIGRFEGRASEYYKEYKENEEKFRDMPIMKMSALTHNLLRGIDYEDVKQIREQNFLCLHNLLGGHNGLVVRKTEGPFAYPFLIKNGFLVRKALQEKEIYIPTLWPDVLEKCDQESLEYQYTRDILPLPTDQRYDVRDMEYIAEMIKRCIS